MQVLCTLQLHFHRPDPRVATFIQFITEEWDLDLQQKFLHAWAACQQPASALGCLSLEYPMGDLETERYENDTCFDAYVSKPAHHDTQWRGLSTGNQLTIDTSQESITDKNAVKWVFVIPTCLHQPSCGRVER